MKEYTKPELFIEELLIDDVICASNFGYNDDFFNEEPNDNWFNA